MKALSHAWKQSGSISLWRYTQNESNYPGWHLSADADGCASLSALLQSLVQDGHAVTRTVLLEAPNHRILSVPNNLGGRANHEAPGKLRIRFSGDSGVWSFPPALEPAELTFGKEWLEPLQRGLDAIARGQGDYYIGIKQKDSLPLWFWWRLSGA